MLDFEDAALYATLAPLMLVLAGVRATIPPDDLETTTLALVHRPAHYLSKAAVCGVELRSETRCGRAGCRPAAETASPIPAGRPQQVRVSGQVQLPVALDGGACVVDHVAFTGRRVRWDAHVFDCAGQRAVLRLHADPSSGRVRAWMGVGEGGLSRLVRFEEWLPAETGSLEVRGALETGMTVRLHHQPVVSEGWRTPGLSSECSG